MGEWKSLELGEQNRFSNEIENANLFATLDSANAAHGTNDNITRVCRNERMNNR